MKIGGTLTFELTSKTLKNTNPYRCKIIEKNNDFFWIDYPIDTATNQTTTFPDGTHLNVSFVGDDNAVYTFQTILIQKDTLENIPAFLLHYPKTMERLQRRNYIRIDTALDISMKVSEKISFTSVTKDISGGGVAAIIPNDTRLSVDSFVDVWIVLPMGEEKLTYIEATMQVIRMSYQSDQTIVSMEFIDLSNRFREKIMQFCFKKEREQRIKELS